MTSVDEYQKAFWTFSLDRYGRSGVSEICLKLQEDVGIDVNMLLLCLWCGQRGRALTQQQLLQLIDGEAGHWHRDIVLPLRAARKAMKGRAIAGDSESIEQFRTQIKTIEIESERWEQLSLAAAVANFVGDASTEGPRTTLVMIALQNIRNYIELMANEAEEWSQQDQALTDLVETCIN